MRGAPIPLTPPALLLDELPFLFHLHPLVGTSTTGTLNVTTGNVFGVSQTPVYNQPVSLLTINPQTVGNVGGSQPHNNMMPYLVLNFIIALQGIFPSRN